MSKSVRGFHNDEVSRKLMQRKMIEEDVICMDGIDVEADMTFDSAFFEFDDETHRPYIAFRDGHISSIKGNLPFDVSQCSFTKKDAPDIELKWNLSNDELKQLIDKGIYGFDKSYKKCKSMFEIPAIFTDVLWSGIPLKADIMAIQSELEDGTKVPIISVKINKPFEQETNSFDSGYENIATCFEQPEFYEEGYVTEKDEYFTLSDNEIIKSVSELDTEKNDNKVRTLTVLTPSEKQEQMIRGELYQQVRENIEAVQSQNQVDEISLVDESLEIEYKEDVVSEKEIDEFEPYTIEELTDLHLVNRKEEEHKVAKAKWAVDAMKKQEREINKETIEKAVAQGEEILRKEEIENKNNDLLGVSNHYNN